MHRQNEILESLRLLLQLLTTRIPPSHMEAHQAFCTQLTEETDRDSGRLVILAIGVLRSLLTGRGTVSVEGLFGAGKTISIVFLLAWLVLTTPGSVKFSVVAEKTPQDKPLRHRSRVFECPLS